MKIFSHEEQQRIWDEEHTKPTVLLQMDSDQASSGVVLFYDFLGKSSTEKVGVEMGCGKGRNVIWLAQQEGIQKVYGLDFSPAAIAEAQRRAGSYPKAEFVVHDVSERWPFEDGSVDFVIDCFATTDLESPAVRAAAVKESLRVLKPGGHLLAYLLSVDDAYHKEMIQRYPTPEKNAFHHPETGKFEKAFDADELAELHNDFELVKSRRIEKTAEFNGKSYPRKHFWNVYRKRV